MLHSPVAGVSCSFWFVAIIFRWCPSQICGGDEFEWESMGDPMCWKAWEVVYCKVMLGHHPCVTLWLVEFYFTTKWVEWKLSSECSSSRVISSDKVPQKGNSPPRPFVKLPEYHYSWGYKIHTFFASTSCVGELSSFLSAAVVLQGEWNMDVQHSEVHGSAVVILIANLTHSTVQQIMAQWQKGPPPRWWFPSQPDDFPLLHVWWFFRTWSWRNGKYLCQWFVVQSFWSNEIYRNFMFGNESASYIFIGEFQGVHQCFRIMTFWTTKPFGTATFFGGSKLGQETLWWSIESMTIFSWVPSFLSIRTSSFLWVFMNLLFIASLFCSIFSQSVPNNITYNLNFHFKATTVSFRSSDFQ